MYGTTGDGGANGYGTVFKISPSGTPTTLYSSCSQRGCTDGSGPDAPLVQATDVFTSTGTLTTLYSLCSQSGCADGSEPFAALVQDTNGSFFGTTHEGGSSGACTGGCGTVFSLSVGLKPFVETQTPLARWDQLSRFWGPASPARPASRLTARRRSLR
ncbi:MAG TPA: choice-of-anchor tandem repeat GloVer-containing protein [Terriglobia bacterium]